MYLAVVGCDKYAGNVIDFLFHLVELSINHFCVSVGLHLQTEKDLVTTGVNCTASKDGSG